MADYCEGGNCGDSHYGARIGVGVAIVIIFILICLSICVVSLFRYRRLRNVALTRLRTGEDADGLGTYTYPTGTYPPTMGRMYPNQPGWNDPYGADGEPLPRYEPPPTPPPPFEEKINITHPDRSYDPDHLPIPDTSTSGYMQHMQGESTNPFTVSAPSTSTVRTGIP